MATGTSKWLRGTALATDFGRPGRDPAEFVFRWGTNVPRSHPLNVHAQRAAEAIRSETDGRFDLQLFPDNELGGDSRMFARLLSGELECFTLSGVNVLSSLIPGAAIYGVGFAFTDYPSIWRALDGRLGEHLRAQIEKAGFVVMEKIWDNGFRQITTSTKPIQSPDDLAGLRMRVPIGALWTSLFRSLGAVPGGIDFADVYPALQGKIFDGQENSLGVIATARLNEVQTYCSLSNHMWDGWWLLINRAAWQRLPEDVREAVSRNLDAAALSERQEVANLHSKLKRDLASSGLVFNELDAAPFRAKLRESGFYSRWRGVFGEQAWQLLEEACGQLAGPGAGHST